MQTFELDHNDFKNRTSADDSLLVKFFNKSVQDKAETVKQGRPIFKEIEYIDIRALGERHSMACRPARDTDINRFPRHYEAFKQRIELPVEGTPLIEWALINRSLADELAFHGIKTVEQLAATNDTNVQKFMGLGVYKQKAKDWLEVSKDDNAALHLKDELAKRDAQIAEMQAQLAELTAAKPKRTRRKKVETDDGEIQDDQ